MSSSSRAGSPTPPASVADAERRLRAAYDGATTYMGLMSPEGILLDVNRAALELVQATREEVLGRPFAQTPWFSDPLEQAQVRQALQEAREGRMALLYTVQQTPGGRAVEVELRLSPVMEDGRVAWIVPEGRDITVRRQAQRALQASEQRLSGILDVAADAIISVDDEQRIVLFNQGAEAIFGYTAADVLGQRLEMLLPERSRGGHEQRVRRFATADAQARYMNQRSTITGRRSNGELFPAEATISHLDAGGTRLYTAVLRDVSERLRAEAELARARRYTEALLASVPEGIFGLDQDGRIVFANHAATGLLGYEVDELLGRDAHALLHQGPGAEGPCPLEQCSWSAIQRGVATGDADDVYWRADGSSIPVEYTATPFDLEGEVAGAVVVFRDISERKQAEAALRSLAWTDELTGLHNRRGFHAHARQALQQAQRSGTPCLLLFIDLDYLKPINDQHGHLAGDMALREVAGLLRSVFRDSDVLARVGGDEFVVLAVGCGSPQHEAAARERLRDALATRNAGATVQFPLSVSTGSAWFDPKAPTSLDALIGQADAALYEEKRRRGTVR